MPGVQAPSVLDEVHRSCATALQDVHHGVSVDTAAVAALAQSLIPDAAAVRACGARAPVYPLRFDSLEAEVNCQPTLPTAQHTMHSHTALAALC